jgi:acetylornithine aminotransferase
MEAIKVIPEIIKVKGRGLMLGVEFDFDVLWEKMIIEKHILQVDLVIKSIANSSALTITTTAIDTFIVALQESLAELK